MPAPELPEQQRKATSFALLGLMLAMGAPLGLVVVRSIVSNTPPTFGFLAEQVRNDSVTYGYITFASLMVFVVLGHMLGAREDELAKTSITDPLTRLHNRRHIHARLEQELARAVRHDTPFALLLVDVDHLKEINDRGGHDAGDTALVCVGEALRSTCRLTDLPARYGGDEFVVLLPSTSGSQALELCERIRKALCGCKTKLPIPLTVSIGVADLRAARTSATQLIEAADSALYMAKKAGRDRAVLAEEQTLATA